MLILALRIRRCCSLRYRLPGSFFSRPFRYFLIRCRISAAAALEKVRTRMREASSFSDSSSSIRTIRSERTVVLPLPAAAPTRMEPPRSLIAWRCSSVNDLSAILFLLSEHLVILQFIYRTIQAFTDDPLVVAHAFVIAVFTRVVFASALYLDGIGLQIP